MELETVKYDLSTQANGNIKLADVSLYKTCSIQIWWDLLNSVDGYLKIIYRNIYNSMWCEDESEIVILSKFNNSKKIIINTTNIEQLGFRLEKGNNTLGNIYFKLILE
jgi:hypothetical protein